MIRRRKQNMTRSSDPSAAVLPVAAYPRRFWWLKRLSLAAVVVAIALLALRIWWGAKARGILNTEIAAFHAGGEPILPEDFATPIVSDADNGAFYLKKAAEAVDENVPVPS